MIEELFLRDLKRDMDKLAHETLSKTLPPEMMIRLSGHYQGLKAALTLFEKLVRGNEE